jgi:hypothetical protein
MFEACQSCSHSTRRSASSARSSAGHLACPSDNSHILPCCCSGSLLRPLIESVPATPHLQGEVEEVGVESVSKAKEQLLSRLG